MYKETFSLAVLLSVSLIPSGVLCEPKRQIGISGPEIKNYDLGQNPELLPLAAKTGESVIVEMREPATLAVAQAQVNVNLWCLPLLQQHPGGTVQWSIARTYDHGIQYREIVESSYRIQVGGDENEWLNITSTILIPGAEPSDTGFYFCEVCSDRGKPEEECHEANVTLQIIGEPPIIDAGEANDAPISETNDTVSYKIGTDFCIPRNSRKAYSVICNTLRAYPAPEVSFLIDNETTNDASTIFGNWTCVLDNVFGRDEAQSVVSLCEDDPVTEPSPSTVATTESTLTLNPTQPQVSTEPSTDLPFIIQLVNGSPRFSESSLLIDFITTQQMADAVCYLEGQTDVKLDCVSGHVRYHNLPTGSYIFRIVATSTNGERAVFRRIVHVGESGDEGICAVHLINEGLTVEEGTASMFFRGTEAVSSYMCRLRSTSRRSTFDTGYQHCASPIRYSSLEKGEYRFQVLPVGCENRKRLSMKFKV